jgi:hypothetical protein
MICAEMNARRFGVAVAAIVLVAAMLRFDALGSGLPNPRTRPDELPVVMEMQRPASGNFAIEMLIYPNAYVYATWLWVEAGLRVAPLFGIDPPGGYRRTLLLAPEQIFLIGRAMSATAGTLAVLFVVLLARREWGDGAALSAGLLVATCFLHARDSHALKPDALLSLAVIVTLGAAASLAERASPMRIVGAGAALGLAMATKYTGLLMAVPVYAAGVLGSPRRGWRRALPLPAVAAGLVGAAVFALTSPYLVFQGPLFEFVQNLGQLVLPDLVSMPPESTVLGGGEKVIFEPPPGLDLDAYRDRPWYFGLIFHTTFSMWYGVGAAATLLAPFALVWGLRSRRPLPFLAALACAVHFVVISLTPAVTARYLTQILPMLLLLEAGLLARLAQRFVPTPAAVALAVATAAVALQPLSAILGHNRIAGETDTRVMATHWLQENTEAGARLAYAGAVLMPYGQPTPPKESRVVAFGLDRASLDEAEVDYIVTHDHPLYFSTVDRAAMEELSPRMHRLAEFDPRRGSLDDREPVFEDVDAYYIPFYGFDRVARPGPHIEIFSFEPAGKSEGKNERREP